MSTTVEEWHRQEKLRTLIEGPTSSITRAAQGDLDSPTMRAAMGYFGSPSAKLARDCFDSDMTRMARGLIDSPTHKIALELAEYESSVRSLSGRMSLFDTDWRMHDQLALQAFAHSAAMSDALAIAIRVDHGVIEAARAYSATAMPNLASLAAHRSFLDASGLYLPRILGLAY